ncbi:MAG TPA: tRNA (adenosine(37)-N6)-threonylcarbamoyltransferase complex transferase subunit TsaD [Candidatus Paceibacterota bacterium]|nr:tRNA (adenosine(37)-N6)-threonylcarbamoyltransferase complex transferase subunit TsaD [Candidatus Paceibacterota bacterium]
MRILAIETSCDETGLALVEGVKTNEGFAFTVLDSALLSQAALHAGYGGVYPNLAKREHEKNLPVLFEKFKDAKVDAIAVTNGPGLEPALWTGVEFAKKVAKERGVPLLAVNHMEGHLLSSLAQKEHSGILENTRIVLEGVKLPVLALLISGGHTEFVVMKNWFEYEIVGKTLDDAVGEAYDKVARMLGLSYPGGPEVSRLAESIREKQKILSQKSLGLLSSAEDGAAGQTFVQEHFVSLPRPMINSKDCDVSFSGLKTAVLYALRDRGGIQKLSGDEIAAVAREFEDATSDVLVHKTKRALEESGAQTFVIGGGVAANKHIRESLQKLVAENFNEVEMRLPELNITGDNAIMIAEAALARALSGKNDQADETLRAIGNLSIQTS